MTSTTSFKERLRQFTSMFVWDLKACSGTLTVYAILAGVFTLVSLTLCLVSDSIGGGIIGSSTGGVTLYEQNNSILLSDKIQYFQVAAASIIFLLTIVFTIIYTIKVYSYMHDKRKADFYGSMPISRTVQYLTKTVSAYLFSILPALFFMGIISLISICTGTVVVTEVVDIYLQMIIGTLACVSAYGLIAACCGTTINAVIMFLVMCVSYPIATMFIRGTVNGFFYGVYTASLNGSFIMNALNPIAAYGGSNVIYWIIFSILCIAGGTFLVKKRKSERAQTSFAYYLPCYVFKLIVAFIAGMFLGTLFGSLNILGNGMLGFALGFILASVSAYIIVHLIFYKGFSRLLKTSIPLAVLAVVVIAGVALCNADITGYNSYIPDAASVKSAGFIASDYYYRQDDTSIYDNSLASVDDFTDEEQIKNIIAAHSAITDYDKSDSSYKFRMVWVGMLDSLLEGGITDNGGVYAIAYRLDNGSVVTRYYSEVYSYDAYEYDYLSSTYYDPFYSAKLCDARDSIITSKAYIMKYSALVNAKETDFDNMYVYGYNDEDSLGEISMYSEYTYNTNDPSEEQILFKKITSALEKDLAQDNSSFDEVLADVYGTISYENYAFDYKDKTVELVRPLPDDIVCGISFSITNSTGDTFYSDNYMSECYYIPKTYTNTLNVLVSEGILNSDYSLNSNHRDYYGYAFVY